MLRGRQTRHRCSTGFHNRPPFLSLSLSVFSRSAPGAVGHLSFTEILDTSLKVSWREPGEKNGVLTGTSRPVLSRPALSCLTEIYTHPAAPLEDG